MSKTNEKRVKRTMQHWMCRRADLIKLYDVMNRLPEAPTWTRKTVLADGIKIPVIAVNITADMVKAAIYSSELQHLSGKILGLKEYYISLPEHRKAGMVGQFAVGFYLYENFERVLQSITIGKGDSGDVTLGHFKADVKTHRKIHEENFATIKIEQFNRNPYPLYIFASVWSESKIVIWGYAWWPEIKYQWQKQWKEWVKANPGHEWVEKHFPNCYLRDLTDIALEHPIEDLKNIFKQQLEHAKP